MIDLSSTAFGNNQKIPVHYTGDGDDISPRLNWGESLPPETQELALVCDDPDAPSKEPWVHWLVYKIPTGTTELPEATPKDPSLKVPYGALQGKNSWGTIGYRGPMPPPGSSHRYFFKLYVLDTKLDVKPGLDKKALLAAMKGHVIAETSLIGTYSR